MPRKKSLYQKVYDIEGLHDAWSHIYVNGMTSFSNTNISVQEFKINEHENLYRIRRDLRNKKFNFDNIAGIGLKKSGKENKPRPIVLSPPSVRIVQRSILNVLQSKPEIKKYLEVPSSFGAIKGKGVPEAIKALINAIKDGATHYIKSDIISFFTRIKRPLVINELSNCFPKEKEFINIIDQATNLEVNNLSELSKEYGEEFKQLFIFNEVGTPQGCCLSPIFGNILLYNFDISMNKNDIVCLRYLDDFIILGPSLKSVKFAFKKAIELLDTLGLEAYDPSKNKIKAKQGSILKPFNFLGIEFDGNTIRPSIKSKTKLLNEIDGLITESQSVEFSKVKNGKVEDRSVIKTLNEIDKKVKGWGNQYYFCNDKSLWGSLDSEIDERINRYLQHSFNKAGELNSRSKRRLLGLHLMTDSKSKPFS